MRTNGRLIGDTQATYDLREEEKYGGGEEGGGCLRRNCLDKTVQCPRAAMHLQVGHIGEEVDFNVGVGQRMQLREPLGEADAQLPQQHQMLLHGRRWMTKLPWILLTGIGCFRGIYPIFKIVSVFSIVSERRHKETPIKDGAL